MTVVMQDMSFYWTDPHGKGQGVKKGASTCALLHLFHHQDAFFAGFVHLQYQGVNG